MGQQCPKMIMHEESNEVTKNVSEVVSPEAKVRLRSTAEEMEEEEEPSKDRGELEGQGM